MARPRGGRAETSKTRWHAPQRSTLKLLDATIRDASGNAARTDAIESLNTMKPLLIFLAALAAAQAADYKLTSSPQTVVWGYYWAGAKPVLTIKSGDRVEILTMSTGSPQRWRGWA